MTSIKITVDRIQPGLHVRLPVKWNEHPFLFNSFKIKNDEQIRMIRHLGIKHVYINLNQSDVAPLSITQDIDIPSVPDDNIDLETQKMWEEKQSRIDKLSLYRSRVINCEKEFERSLGRMRSAMLKIRHRPEESVEDATALIEDIVDKLLSDDNMTLHLMNDKSEFEDIYCHSLNVAVIAMMVGKAKGYDKAKLKELSFAALFHDIGKIKIPSAILQKQVPLSEPENSYLKLHTKYGVDLADTIRDFPESAKKVIAQHHECNDGSGYPKGLKESEIDEMAQIIAVVNAFDKLCHHHVVSEQKTPYIAISHLYNNCKHLYSSQNLEILVKFMGVYPPGTTLQLSNDSVGLVISVNPNNILFPNVLIYDPNVPRAQAPIIDLEGKDIKIMNVIHPSQLPEKIREYLNPRSRISYFFDSDE